jgi:outer membrane protein TolC
MKKQVLYLLLLSSLGVFAQERVSLEMCYDLVNSNYPLAQQTYLFEAQNNIDVSVIQNEKLPTLDLAAQATYQSEVTQVPLASLGIDPLNKDQYRATLGINQLIYAGGTIDTKAKAKQAERNTKQKQVEVSLHALKFQINQLFFSILLNQENRELLLSKQHLLQAQLKEVQSGIKNGVVLPTSDKVIEVELLKIDQQLFENNSDRNLLISSLSTLIGKPLSNETIFDNEPILINKNNILQHPELDLFQFQKEEIANNQNIIGKQNFPKLSAFATGGYGNPGLNALENSFQAFYITGLKLNWNVFDWNTTKKQQSLDIQKQIIDTQVEEFTLNNNIALEQQQTEINNITAFIESDLQIISLRKDVLQTANSQLKNGVITASAYITELTNLYDSENTLLRHKIQLELAKANYNSIKGN